MYKIFMKNCHEGMPKKTESPCSAGLSFVFSAFLCGNIHRLFGRLISPIVHFPSVQTADLLTIFEELPQESARNAKKPGEKSRNLVSPLCSLRSFAAIIPAFSVSPPTSYPHFIVGQSRLNRPKYLRRRSASLAVLRFSRVAA